MIVLLHCSIHKRLKYSLPESLHKQCRGSYNIDPYPSIYYTNIEDNHISGSNTQTTMERHSSWYLPSPHPPLALLPSFLMVPGGEWKTLISGLLRYLGEGNQIKESEKLLSKLKQEFTDAAANPESTESVSRDQGETSQEEKDLLEPSLPIEKVGWSSNFFLFFCIIIPNFNFFFFFQS